MGLAIYNGVILDIHFPFVVYKKMMKIKPSMEDLKSFNPELYQGLEKLLQYPGNVEEVMRDKAEKEREKRSKRESEKRQRKKRKRHRERIQKERRKRRERESQ